MLVSMETGIPYTDPFSPRPTGIKISGKHVRRGLQTDISVIQHQCNLASDIVRSSGIIDKLSVEILFLLKKSIMHKIC